MGETDVSAPGEKTISKNALKKELKNKKKEEQRRQKETSSAQDYHPENVLSSMETIMSLVLKESEDISEALPVAQKLGEKVLETCATKVKPYLIQAVKSLGVSLEDYNDIIGSMCQEISGSIEQKDVHAGDENKVSCCATKDNIVVIVLI
ncbi:hypothetical protein Peur_024028 [Populus x canadensis]